jgi:hypothetical protein
MSGPDWWTPELDRKYAEQRGDMNKEQLEGFIGQSSVTRTGVASVRIKRRANVLDVTFFPEKDIATVITTCSLCMKPNTLENLPADPLLHWLMGLDNIQHLMPTTPIGVRESLLSGSHGACFDAEFEEEGNPDWDGKESEDSI